MSRKPLKILVPAALGALTLTAAPAVSAANLVSHFTFDTDASNAVSPSLDGTLEAGAGISNTVFRAGGGALDVSGVQGYANAGTDGVPGAGGAYYQGTVAMFVKANPGAAPGDVRFMGQQNGNPASFGSDDRMSFEVGTNAQGSIQIFIRADDSASSTNNRYKFRHQEAGSVFPSDWADGDWHHIAFTWAIDAVGDASDVQIYIDGAPVGTVVTEAGLEADPALSPLNPWESPGLFIGARNNRVLQGGAADGFLDGYIDDLRVYDGPLSGEDIAALAAIPEPASAAVLLALGLAGAARRRR